MKAFKVTFSHGHFIDKESKKRIIPIQGEEYIITASENSFSIEEENEHKNQTLSSDDKKKWVINKYGIDNIGLIAEEGTVLYFKFGNRKIVKGDENKSFTFSCILQEDLYMHKLKNRKADSIKSWRLVECICSLEKCEEGNLTFTEKIQSNSLNTLFNDTVMFFFQRQRTTACNVFSAFNLRVKENSNTFSIKSLNNLRINWVNSNLDKLRKLS